MDSVREGLRRVEQVSGAGRGKAAKQPACHKCLIVLHSQWRRAGSNRQLPGCKPGARAGCKQFDTKHLESMTMSQPVSRVSEDFRGIIRVYRRFSAVAVWNALMGPERYPRAAAGACQLLFFSLVILRDLGRRVKGCPGRVRRCLTRRSSSHRAAARTCRIASAPSGLFQNISVPFTR